MPALLSWQIIYETASDSRNRFTGGTARVGCKDGSSALRKNYSTAVCHRQAPYLSIVFGIPINTPPVLTVPVNTAEEIQSIFAEMQLEYLNKLTEFEEALGALLRILFIRAERIYERAHSNIEPGRSSALMRGFRLALEENFRTTQYRLAGGIGGHFLDAFLDGHDRECAGPYGIDHVHRGCDGKFDPRRAP